MAQAFNLTAQLNLRGPSNVRQIVADVKKQIGTISGDIKFNIDPAAINNTSKLNRSLQELNTNLSAVRSNASAAASAIKNFGQSVSSVGNTSSKLSGNLSKAAKGADNLGTASTKTAKNISVARTEMEEFGRQSALAIRRFAAFSAVTGVFFSLNRAINSGLKSFIDFDKELVRLQQVTGKSAEGLKGLQDEITRLSIGLGVSSDSLIQVSSTLAQAGLSASETRSALEALARSSLAPSFDDMNQTVEGSIALMRQFGISAKELEKALGSVNAVAAAFAVESGDIIAAIQRTGGVFANASKGVSEGTDALNEFIAVFTSVRATTRESAETIATGLRTIFTRIQRQGTIEALREYGVSLTDVEGKFVGAYKAVQLLSEGLNRIDPRDVRFSQIVEELGGFRQIGKVIPLIQQFATAQEALKVAQAGQGSLAADALKAQLSLANQISKVREEFLALIRTLGQSDTFQTLARGALGFASGLIKITGALKGVLPALAILGAGASLRGITQFTGGFIGGLKKVPKGGQGGGDQNPSIARSIGSNLGSSLVGAKTEQVSRDLDQNSAALDKVSGKLDNLASVISKIPTGPSIDPALLTNLIGGITTLNTNISNLNTSLASYGSLLQSNTDGLSNNTSGLNNLYAAVVNLEAAISNTNFGGGGGPTTASGGGKILGFGKGGSVPGSGKGDKVPALLEPGEVVMSNRAVSRYGRGNLVRMNKYAAGGQAKIASVNKKLGVYDGDTIKINVTPTSDPFDTRTRLLDVDSFEIRGGQPWQKELGNRAKNLAADYYNNNNKDENYILQTISSVQGNEKFGRYLIKDEELANVIKNKKLGTPYGIKASTLTKKTYEEKFGQSVEQTLKDTAEFKSVGGKIQRFMAGGEAEETAPWGDTATVPEILRLLSFDGAAKIGRVANPRELLKRKKPTEDEKAKIKAIRDEATKTYNRRIGAAKGVQTRLAGQGLKFAAVGMFGDTFPDETYDAEGTKGTRKVLITAAIMDRALAEQLDVDFGGGIESIAQQAAEKTMIGNITKGLLGGKQAEFDFDRTLAVGADDIASLKDFRDPTIVQEKLKNASLTRLGRSLVDLVKAHPEILPNMRIVTARSQSTVPLVQRWLADKGLGLSDSQFVGVGGDAQIVSESDIPALKAAQLRAGSLFVDDSGPNIMAAEASGKNIEAYQYGAQLTIPNPNAEASVKGILFEKMIQNLGGPGAIAGLGFDYPKGLGPAAKYFGIDPDIPTDAKRTIVGAGTIKDNVRTYLKAMGYAGGGMIMGKGRGKKGAKGARDVIEPISSETYLKWAQGIYDEYDKDPSLVMTTDELGIRMPPEIALANKLLTQHALQTGGAGLSVGKRFVATPEQYIDDALRPYLVPNPNNPNELGFYEDVVAKFGRAKAVSAAATKKLGKAEALKAVEARMETYTGAENAISEFKKSGVLNVSSPIMDYLIQSINNPDNLPLDSKGINSIKKKLTKSNVDAFNALVGSQKTPVSVQGQRTKLGEVFNAILETYGSDVSDLEVDNITRAMGEKLNIGGLVQKFAFGGKADGPGFEEVRKQIMDKYPEIDFRISKRKKGRGFGYNLLGALKTDGGLLGSKGLQFEQPSNLQKLIEVSDKMATSLINPQELAVGGLADATSEMASLMGGLYGNRKSSEAAPAKKEKNFGKISLLDYDNMINASYSKNNERSGYVQALKMRDNLYYVGLSKATGGYGPRLYDVVMEAVSEKGAMLTSDRSSVSGDAKKVWEYYFKNRGDVKKTPLEPENWTKNQSLIDPKLYGRKETWPPSTDPAWVLQSGYSKSPSLINDPNSVVRSKKKLPQSSGQMALEYFGRANGGLINRFADGGTVPALVSNGEAYVPPKLAKKIGYGKLNRMNQADRNGMGRFADGGISVFKGPGSGTSDSIPTSLSVGSFIIREKATKALGLNKGGAVQRFADGGSPTGSATPPPSTKKFRSKKTGKVQNFPGLWDDEWEEIVESQPAVPQAAAVPMPRPQIPVPVTSGGGSPMPPSGGPSGPRTPPPVPKSAEQQLAAVQISALEQKSTAKQNVKSEYDLAYQNAASQDSKKFIQDEAREKYEAAKATIESSKASQEQAILQDLLAQKAKENSLSVKDYISSLQEEITTRTLATVEKDGGADPVQARQQAINETISSRGLQAFNIPDLSSGNNLVNTMSQLSNKTTNDDNAAIAADKAKTEASTRATEALELMRLKAEQNGQTLTQYEKSLKQSLINLSKDLQQAVPQQVSQFSQTVGGLTGRLRDTGDQDAVSDAKDILTKQLSEISSGIDPALLESTVNDLIESIQKGDKSFVDIINSSKNLQQIFNTAASDAGALDNALANLSATTGLPIEALTNLATAADVTSSNLLDKNLKSLERFSNILAKGSLAIGAFATGLSSAIKMFGGQNDRGSVAAAAGIEGFGSTVSTLGAGLSQMKGPIEGVLKGMGGMGGGMAGLAGKIGPMLTNPVTAAVAVVGVAAVGVAAAFKEAHNAAREFDKALAAKNVENAMDKVAQAFDDFSKDAKRLDLLDNIKNELTIAGANVAEGIRIDAEVPKAMWVNLFDALGGGSEAAQRSMILEKQGVGAYLQSSAFGQNSLGMMANATLLGIPDAIAQAVTGQSMFKGSSDSAALSREFYMQQMAPDMAKEQSAQFKPVADATLRLFEEKLRTGTSMQDVIGELKDASGAPTQLANNIAQSNPIIQEQILRIRANNDIRDDEKQAMINNIVAQEAEYKARINLEATLRSMEIDKLNREMKKFVVSLERVFNNMDQSIERTSFELDAMSRSAELSSAALSGNAKSGEIALKSLNVLRNLDAYAPREREQAVNQAAGFFGSQADVVAPLIGLGNKLEKTVLSTVNREIEKNPEATNERIAAGIRSALDQNLRDLGLPDNLTDKLSNQVQKAFAEISKSGTDAKDVSFDEIVEQVPAFADAISASRKAEELAIKALEFYQKNLNDYANAMNQMVDYQIEANSRFRRASDIQIQGLLKLNEAFGRSTSLFQQQQIINQQTASLTGGATNPAAIGQNILNLENTRSQLQSMSDTAASRGPGGRDEFMLMQNRLRNVNVSLRENYEALKQMADSTEMAEAAMNKIQEVQAKRQAGMNLLEKVVTSDPGEVAKLNNSIARLSNNMAGRTNLSTSEQRGEDLQTFNMIAPLLGEGQRQNELRANVLESMLKESGQGVNPLFAQVLDSLRNPEADPEMQEAIAYYKSSLAQQSQANMMLGQIQQLMAQNTAEIAAEKLAHSIEGVKLNFETQVLNEIRDGIWKLVERAGANPAGMSVGGIVYASAGQMINFQPKGTDTVPAMLTPGEFVVNRRSAQANLPLLQNINSGNYNRGGKVSYYADGGLVLDSNWSNRNITEDYANRQSKQLSTDNLFKYPKELVDKNKFIKPENTDELVNFLTTRSNSKIIYKYPANYIAVNKDNGDIGQPDMYDPPFSPNINVIPGWGYDSISVLAGGPSFATSLNDIMRLNGSNPLNFQPDIYRNRTAFEVPVISSDKLDKFSIEQNDIDKVKRTYSRTLSQYGDLSKIEVKEKINPPNLNPSLTPANGLGRPITISGLSTKGEDKDFFYTTSPHEIIPAKHAIGFRQDTYDAASWLLNLGNVLSGTGFVTETSNLHTLPVAGSEKMTNDQGTNNYGKLIFKKAIKFNESPASSQYVSSGKEFMSDIVQAIKNLENPSLDETKQSKETKDYLSNLEALYNRNTFRAKFNKNEPFNKEGVEFPITLYNMEKNKWKQILQQQDIIGDTSYKNIDDANKFALSEDHFIAISQKDPVTGAPKNTRKLPWVSNAFNTVKNASEQIFSGSQTAFGIGGEDGLVKLISRTSEAYNVAPFNFTYDQVTGKLYDTISKAFVGDPLNYIIVKPQDQTSKFPLAELLSTNNKSLYADSIDVLLANLKNNTPIYDVLSGIETPPLGQPFKYSLNGKNIGLIDSSLFTEIPDTYKMSLTDQDKASVITSTNGRKNIIPVENFFAENYQKKREQDIKNARSLIAKTKTATVDRQKVTADEAKFSEPIRLSIARAVQPLLSKNLADGTGIKISATPPDKISQVGMIAGRLAQEATDINDVTSPRRSIIDAWRALYVDLYKPANPAQTAEYLKNLGIPVDRKLYGDPVRVNEGGLDKISYYRKTPISPETVLTAINREIALIRSKAFAGGDVDIEVSDRITDLAEGAILHDVDPKTGLKSGTNPKGKQPSYAGAATWPDVHKMALTPENLFSGPKTRLNIIDILKEYYTKASDKKGRKLYDQQYTDALDQLREWYNVQDSILYKGLSVEKIKNNIQSLQNDKVRSSDIDNLQKKATQAHLLLTGNIYGSLPTSSRLITLLEARILEKEEELKEEAKQAGLPGDTPQLMAKGGVVPMYASGGALVNFKPKGTDTVPAMLTPGEFVINRESTQKYKPVLEAINSGNYNRGGIVNYLNKGGYIPEYKFFGGLTGAAQSIGQSFDFTKYLNGLMGSITSSITEAFDKALSNLKQPNNAAGGVSNTSGDIASIDNFVNRLNNIANILSNIYIPPQITITGKHDVVVTINGDTVLNQLRPDIAGIVVSAIKGAFRDLKAKNPENNTINFNIDIDPRSLT